MKYSSKQFCDDMNKNNILTPYAPSYIVSEDEDLELVELKEPVETEEEEE